jgi:hypothetical protein
VSIDTTTLGEIVVVSIDTTAHTTLGEILYVNMDTSMLGEIYMV